MVDGGKYVDVPGGSAKLVAVPNLRGASRDAAAAQTNAVGLRVAFDEESTSDLARAGFVMRQIPAAGEQVEVGSQVTAFLGTAQVAIDFRNRAEGSIRQKNFTEHGVSFSIVGDTQSCGDAKLELQQHKLLGHYLASSPTGDFGLSCWQLQIRINFPAPVREITAVTAGPDTAGEVHLLALDQDGNDLHWRIKPVETGHVTRLMVAAPGQDDGASAAYFYGDKVSLLYALTLKR
jgi:hypothetical protein